jgi:hypothetical protein
MKNNKGRRDDISLTRQLLTQSRVIDRANYLQQLCLPLWMTPSLMIKNMEMGLSKLLAGHVREMVAKYYHALGLIQTNVLSKD